VTVIWIDGAAIDDGASDDGGSGSGNAIDGGNEIDCDEGNGRI
jgi:hypothetical protein